MATTYEPIATQTLTSTASTITFSSIPATYTDLRLVLVGTCTSAANLLFTLNGSSSSIYSVTRIYGNGTTAASANNTSLSFWNFLQAGLSTTNPHLYTMDLLSYTASIYKTALLTGSEDNNGSGAVNAAVGLFQSTAAITSITAQTNTSTFAAGTTATLYGIKAA